jgi:signal transduction histidine kinase
MSHELRTPLNAILGYSDLLRDEAEDLGYDDFIPDLQQIRDSGLHLLSIISDILDISKIEAGQTRLSLETFNLSTLIAEVQNTCERLMAENNNTLEVICDHNLGMMRADRTKVQQILLNLLSNAAKFTHEGKITLTVEKFHANSLPSEAMQNSVDYFIRNTEASAFVFHVSDTGIGMTPEQIEKVFEPFVQADDKYTRKYGGTGLGLAISQHFCQMMQGGIAVKSEPNVGSTFTCWLPDVVRDTQTLSRSSQ